MSTARLFGQVAQVFGILIAGAGTAQAFCDYNQPSASISVQSAGSPAGVQVGIAHISVSATAGTLRNPSTPNCSSYSSTSEYVYINNRLIGYGSVNWNTAEVPDGVHYVRVDVTDSNGGRASAQQQIVVRNNWVRGEVYNHGDYLALNPDVANAFGGDPSRTISHWLYYGIREGRQANFTFSSIEYLEGYGDLMAAFGMNPTSAIDHFIVYGLREGRVGVHALRPEVFNVHYYYAIHGDLQAAFPGNVPALERHWAQYGINEGRRSKEDFSVTTYMQRHGDLQGAFGATNYRAGARHFIQYGIREGRSGI